jgi:serine/threonine-protein kinase
MGEVYLAQDTTLRRTVAVKLLPADFTANQDRLTRFEREAFAASSLNHPNILTIHEIGAEDGHHFIATEFIDGESLRQHMAQGGLELREVLEIGVQVASALAAAHAAGIVHRDIKPENIMLRTDGFVKVLDFGLAKLTEQEKPAPGSEAPTKALNNTAPGMVMGTVNYMSPEQARGKDVDARTDVWSLGVVLYEMVTGRLPFAGKTTADVLGLILHKDPPPLTHGGAHIPAELDRIVTKALRKDKEERYQVVKDLGLDLKSLKQRLEFEAELDRTETPEGGAARRAATSGSGTINPTSRIAAAETGGTSGIHTTTSSAEYIVGEIKQHKRGAVLVLAALLVAILSLAYFSYFAKSNTAAIDSVAVLPFVNASNDANAEYLSDGISESLINSLSQLPQLKVIARSSAFKYKGKEVDVREAAKALGVEAVVTGRIVERAGNLQISVEMVNAGEGTQMWGERYERRAGDLQSVQSEISREIAEKLRLRLTGAQEQQLTKRATENPEAYQLYLNGLFYTRKGGAEGARKALDYYNQAAALDPKFALAHAGAADAYRLLALNSLLDPKEAAAKGKAAAQKALEIDGGLAEAHLVLAGFATDEWDWSGAERGHRRAIELNPNLALAHHRYSQYLSAVGRFEEALRESKRAQELDPLRLNVKGQEGIILFYARRYDEAIQRFQEVLRLEPDNGVSLIFLGYAYAAKGQYAEAISAYQKQISLEGETTSVLCYLGDAYAKWGKRDEALVVLDKLKRTKEYVSPGELATLYVGLGDKEAALGSLERAYAAHDPQLQYLKVDESLDPLRSDPRFQDLVRRVGLPQ